MDQKCTIKCRVCEHSESVDFAHCLRMGWPKHHGVTMILQPGVTKEQIAAAVDAQFLPVMERLRSNQFTLPSRKAPVAKKGIAK